MSDAFHAVETLREVIGDVYELRESLEEQRATLKLSESAEQTLSELLGKVDELVGHMNEITRGLGRVNRTQADAIDDREHALTGKLKHAYLELERSRSDAKIQRKEEDTALRSLEKDLRKALGKDAKDIAREAKAVVARESSEKPDSENPDDDSETS